MIELGVALFAIGLGDLLSGGLGGEVRSWQRAAGGTGVAVATAGFAVLLIGGWNPETAILLLVLVALSALPWSLLRVPTRQQQGLRAQTALAGLVFPLIVVAVVIGTAHDERTISHRLPADDSPTQARKTEGSSTAQAE
jgi:O-antigen ligase